METAGQDITAKLQDMMAVHPQGCAYAQHPRVMQSMKEKLCSVALFYDHAMKNPDPADEESRSFELPDGNIIQVGHDVRMGAPEILFQAGPDDKPSIQNICLQAIQTCDHDFRQDLIRSLVVAGGTSMLPGLAPRLKNELVDLLPGDMGRQVDICVDSQRKYAAWIGGSMFASLSTFEQVVITKQEFEEGKSDLKGLVARKTF
jgi:actin-related protein